MAQKYSNTLIVIRDPALDDGSLPLSTLSRQLGPDIPVYECSVHDIANCRNLIDEANKQKHMVTLLVDQIANFPPNVTRFIEKRPWFQVLTLDNVRTIYYGNTAPSRDSLMKLEWVVRHMPQTGNVQADIEKLKGVILGGVRLDRRPPDVGVSPEPLNIPPNVDSSSIPTSPSVNFRKPANPFTPKRVMDLATPSLGFPPGNNTIPTIGNRIRGKTQEEKQPSVLIVRRRPSVFTDVSWLNHEKQLEDALAAKVAVTTRCLDEGPYSKKLIQLWLGRQQPVTLLVHNIPNFPLADKKVKYPAWKAVMDMEGVKTVYYGEREPDPDRPLGGPTVEKITMQGNFTKEFDRIFQALNRGESISRGSGVLDKHGQPVTPDTTVPDRQLQRS